MATLTEQKLQEVIEQAMDKKIGMFYKSMKWEDVVDKEQSIERFF